MIGGYNCSCPEGYQGPHQGRNQLVKMCVLALTAKDMSSVSVVGYASASDVVMTTDGAASIADLD